MAARSELDFRYDPPDYFEAAFSCSMKYGTLRVENGKAIYILRNPVDRLEDELREEISEETASVFKLRQMLVRRPHTLQKPNLTQFGPDGKRGITVFVDTAHLKITGGEVDFVHTASDGTILRDTKAERIQAHDAFITQLLPKLNHPVLKSMVESFCQATEDSDNELVHLYEVRDAARKHFGNDASALKALHIARRDWSELGRLANDAPLRQGRHRGAHVLQLRDATALELKQARGIAQRVIEAFAAAI